MAILVNRHSAGKAAARLRGSCEERGVFVPASAKRRAATVLAPRRFRGQDRRRRFSMKTIAILGLAATLAAPALPAARGAAAAENWAQHCAACHGADGSGHTKLGRRLGVRDLRDAATQRSFTDRELFTHLKAGETGSDGKARMRPFGDRLDDGELQALVAYVRALARP
jgi:mono/diheme cytochrome c family protein